MSVEAEVGDLVSFHGCFEDLHATDESAPAVLGGELAEMEHV